MNKVSIMILKEVFNESPYNVAIFRYEKGVGGAEGSRGISPNEKKNLGNFNIPISLSRVGIGSGDTAIMYEVSPKPPNPKITKVTIIDTPDSFFKVVVSKKNELSTYTLWDNGHYEAVLVKEDLNPEVFNETLESFSSSLIVTRETRTFPSFYTARKEAPRLLITPSGDVELRDSEDKSQGISIGTYRLNYAKVKNVLFPGSRFG